MYHNFCTSMRRVFKFVAKYFIGYIIITDYILSKFDLWFSVQTFILIVFIVI